MINANVVQENISKLFPDASVSFDAAELPTGSSWIDIESDDQTVTIECKPSFGFGLYSVQNDSYGSGPDEIYRSLDALLRRIGMLLTEHRINIRLKEIRELLGKTQDQFSALSGKKQPSISKLENRTDMQLSSLVKYVSELGGSLEIRAHFEEFDIPISLITNEETAEE
jgi:hypothetical protein